METSRLLTLPAAAAATCGRHVLALRVWLRHKFDSAVRRRGPGEPGVSGHQRETKPLGQVGADVRSQLPHARQKIRHGHGVDAQSKGQVGLDQSQVRRYRSWLRHTILALAAHAVHAVTAARQRERHTDPVLPAHGDGISPDDCGMIALTAPETRRLFVLHDQTRDLPPAAAARRTAFHERWATWRRRHQARARWFHYRTRLARLGW